MSERSRSVDGSKRYGDGGKRPYAYAHSLSKVCMHGPFCGVNLEPLVEVLVSSAADNPNAS